MSLPPWRCEAGPSTRDAARRPHPRAPTVPGRMQSPSRSSDTQATLRLMRKLSHGEGPGE